MKKSLKRDRAVREHLINLKVSDEELKIIRENAQKYSSGNVSRWVRYCAIRLKPNSKDLKTA